MRSLDGVINGSVCQSKDESVQFVLMELYNWISERDSVMESVNGITGCNY